MRAIVLDDDHHSNDLLQLMLKRLNFETLGIEDGSLLFDAVESFQPDVLFIDVYLPGMNGIDLIDEIRHYPDFDRITIIVITAVDTPSDRSAAQDAGADFYLSKPFRPQDLEELLQHRP